MRRELTITKNDAWAIQQVVRDNTYYIAPNTEGAVADTPAPVGLGLRRKINDAIVRFADEPDLESMDVDVTDEEIWIIDRALPVTSYKGAQALLEQLFRIQYEARLGIRVLTVAENEVANPRKVQQVG